MSRARLPRAVLWLGLVSLFTDASSDLIFPLLPIFLVDTLHAGAGMVGLVEGAAEATASLLKLVSGRMADRARRRKPLVLFGYGVSSAVRPLMGAAVAPWMVLALRVLDRVGKGVRSSPRDALLADAAAESDRGRAFGFHRAMDNAGAVVGPALAIVFAGVLHLELRTIFYLASIPAILAMLSLVFGVVEVESTKDLTPAKVGEPAVTPSSLRVYLVVLAVFALGNASDAFLLLRARQLGVPAGWIPALWMLHNGIKAALGTAGGALSDRVGRKRLLVGGWAIYGLSYVGFGFATTAWHIWALFIVYALYYALCEGSEKALVADLAPAAARGRAFGTYNAVVGVAALPASFGFGWLSQHVNPQLPFLVAAALALLASLLLLALVPERKPA